MNSWDKQDTPENSDNIFMGTNDLKLAATLSKGGAVHRKYMRQLQVGMRITAPLFWWKEFDTYRNGVEKNSCSTMHKIHAAPFDISQFSFGTVETDGDVKELKLIHSIVDTLNDMRALYLSNKAGGNVEESNKYWRFMIELLPSAYNQTRNVTCSYEALANMYYWRRTHKLKEWRYFCEFIRDNVPFSMLFTNPDHIVGLFDNKE